MPTIELQNVTKYYKIRKRHRGDKKLEVAVKDIDLTIQQGEFVFIIGSSGSGKSTLLNLIGGGIKPNRGKVCLNHKDLPHMMKTSKNRAARLFGKVLQESTLIHTLTVEENLMLATRISASKPEINRYAQDRVRKVLGLVGMRGVEKMYPVEISTGECRRVELARALITSPPILVLDEVTANLDDDSIWDIFQLLHEINRRGTTVVMATHASQYVNIMCRRVVTLVDGRVFGDVKEGKYGDIVEQPVNILVPYRTDLI